MNFIFLEEKQLKIGLKEIKCEKDSLEEIKYEELALQLTRSLDTSADYKPEQPQRSCNVNSSRLKKDFVQNHSSLNQEQIEKLETLIKQSRQVGGDVKYKCYLCLAELSSRSAITYHIKNRHILKELTNETMWVSQKVKEGARQTSAEGVIKFEWSCTMCENVTYPSHQGLRGHMKSHYKKLFKNDDSQQFIDMLVTSMGIS